VTFIVLASALILFHMIISFNLLDLISNSDRNLNIHRYEFLIYASQCCAQTIKIYVIDLLQLNYNKNIM
jgi:hypothetical protein